MAFFRAGAGPSESNEGDAAPVKEGLRLGRWRGVEVHLALGRPAGFLSFTLLFAAVAWGFANRDPRGALALYVVGLALGVLMVAVHELGHAVAGARYGMPARALVVRMDATGFTRFGGVALTQARSERAATLGATPAVLLGAAVLATVAFLAWDESRWLALLCGGVASRAVLHVLLDLVPSFDTDDMDWSDGDWLLATTVAMHLGWVEALRFMTLGGPEKAVRGPVLYYHLLQEETMGDIPRTTECVLFSGATVKEAVAQWRKNPDGDLAAVVDESGNFQGYVDLEDVERAAPETELRTLVRPFPLVAQESEPAGKTYDRILKNHDFSFAAVCRGRTFLGTVSASTLEVHARLLARTKGMDVRAMTWRERAKLIYRTCVRRHAARAPESETVSGGT